MQNIQNKTTGSRLLASTFHLLTFVRLGLRRRAQGLNAVQNIQSSRLLASIFHLLICACWLPAPAYCLLPVGFHLQPFHCVLELVIGFSVFTHSCSYVQVAHCFDGFAPEQKVDKKLERHELLSTWPYMFDRLAARSIFSSTGSLIARSITKDSDHDGACNPSWLTRRSRA